MQKGKRVVGYGRFHPPLMAAQQKGNHPSILKYTVIPIILVIWSLNGIRVKLNITAIISAREVTNRERKLYES